MNLGNGIPNRVLCQKEQGIAVENKIFSCHFLLEKCPCIYATDVFCRKNAPAYVQEAFSARQNALVSMREAFSHRKMLS